MFALLSIRITKCSTNVQQMFNYIFESIFKSIEVQCSSRFIQFELSFY